MNYFEEIEDLKKKIEDTSRDSSKRTYQMLIEFYEELIDLEYMGSWRNK
jgi:hypothetical protein